MKTHDQELTPVTTQAHPLAALAALALAALLLAAAPFARAADDHGHDHDHAGTSAPAAASPRFAVSTESFDFVGVLRGRLLTMYVDRAADNSPIGDAQIELDFGGRTHKPTRHEGDVYELALAAQPGPGVLDIVARVTVGGVTERLEVEIDVHGPAAADDDHAHRSPWEIRAAWLGGGLLAASLLAFGVQRLRRARTGVSA